MSTPDPARDPETLAATRAALRRAIAGESQPDSEDDAGEFIPGRAGRIRRAGFPRSATMRALLNPRNRAVATALLTGGALLALRWAPRSRAAALLAGAATLNRVLRQLR